MGLAEFGRQALVGSHYGLLEETTHTPNPDYWVLWVWKHLMGPRVLDVQLDEQTNASGNVHVYAHCGPSDASTPSTTIAFINISPNTSYSLNIATATHSMPGSNNAHTTDGLSLDVRLFSTPQGINGKVLAVNGHTLALDGDELPTFPTAVTVDASGGLVLPPYSFGFATLSEPVAACASV